MRPPLAFGFFLFAVWTVAASIRSWMLVSCLLCSWHWLQFIFLLGVTQRCDLRPYSLQFGKLSVFTFVAAVPHRSSSFRSKRRCFALSRREWSFLAVVWPCSVILLRNFQFLSVHESMPAILALVPLMLLVVSLRKDHRKPP